MAVCQEVNLVCAVLEIVRPSGESIPSLPAASCGLRGTLILCSFSLSLLLSSVCACACVSLAGLACCIAVLLVGCCCVVLWCVVCVVCNVVYSTYISMYHTSSAVEHELKLHP